MSGRPTRERRELLEIQNPWFPRLGGEERLLLENALIQAMPRTICRNVTKANE